MYDRLGRDGSVHVNCSSETSAVSRRVQGLTPHLYRLMLVLLTPAGPKQRFPCWHRRRCPAGIGRWLTSKVAGSGEAGGSSSPPGSPAAATTPQKEEDLPRGEPVPLFRSLQDPPRRVHHLLVAPRWVPV